MRRLVGERGGLGDPGGLTEVNAGASTSEDGLEGDPDCSTEVNAGASTTGDGLEGDPGCSTEVNAEASTTGGRVEEDPDILGVTGGLLREKNIINITSVSIIKIEFII